MVLQPLLDRFIFYEEPKSLCGICVSCPLHIEVPERRSVRHRLASIFFDGNEVELIVDAPVVRHRIYRAVVEHQLRMARRLAAVEIVGWREGDERLVGWKWRNKIPDRIGRWSEEAVSREYLRMRSKPRRDNNHSSPRSRPMPRLRKGRTTRNEQSEKRETNHAPHTSLPRLGSEIDYGPALLEATIDSDRMNGATGASDMAGKAAWVAVERCGWQPRYNGADGNRAT